MPQYLDDVIPKPVRKAYDPTKDPNRVKLKSAGPRPVTVTKFSAVFFEKNIGTDTEPNYQQCGHGEPDALPRIRVYVQFKAVKNLDGQPLVLSKKMNAFRGERAEFAQLIAALLRIDAKDVKATNVDLDVLLGASALATTKANKYDVSMLDKLLPVPVVDETDDQPVAPADIVDEPVQDDDGHEAHL